MRRNLAMLLMIGLFSATWAASAMAAPGDLDASFGGTGEVTLQPRGLQESRVSGVAIQPDGKILLVGSAGGYHGSDHDIVVIRLDPDGSPDPSFGLGGVASIDFSEGTKNADDYGNGLALQPNGKIIVVGTSYIDTSAGEGPGNEYGVVARLNTNGTHDPTFGAANGQDSASGGKLIIHLGQGESGGVGLANKTAATNVVVRPNGRIVVVGSKDLEYPSGEPPSGFFFTLALTAEGARDTSFGDDGRASVEFSTAALPRAAALAPNEDLVVAGETLSGGGEEYPAVARLSSAGVLVSGFGEEGGKRVLSDIGTGSIESVAVQPDGKLVFATTIQGPESEWSRAGLIRLNADGSTDSLGGQAFQPIPALGRYDSAGGVAIDPQGRIVLGAEGADADGGFDVYSRLARFTPSGSLDGSFGSGGAVNALVGESVNGHGYSALRTAIQGDGKIVIAGAIAERIDVRRFLGGSVVPPPPPASAGGPATTLPEVPIKHGFRKPKIEKAKISSKRHSATFVFVEPGSTGGGFQCALVKPAKKKHRHGAAPTFSSCHSPQTYKHLAHGKYTFEVRPAGTGTADVADKPFAIGTRR